MCKTYSIHYRRLSMVTLFIRRKMALRNTTASINWLCFVSDTFQLTLVADRDGQAMNESVELDGKDISWDTDREHKFKNPSG